MSDASPQVHEILILGAGPAGYAAGIYAGRARLQALVLDGLGGGGQMATTDIVENYPGVEALSGADLSDRMREQMESFGVGVTFDQIEQLTLRENSVTLKGMSGTYCGRTLIVATGAKHRELCVPGEERLRGRGVSYCATCDGAFFKGQHVALVGGGDTAVKEALYLSRIAAKVTLIHRRDELRAERIIQEKARATANIEFLWHTVVQEILGDKKVRGVRLRHVKTDEKRELALDGVFVFIGIEPQSDLVRGKLALDEGGFIKTDLALRTSHPRVWAVDDVRSQSGRQIACAVGDGVAALLGVQEFLDKDQPAREMPLQCELP